MTGKVLRAHRDAVGVLGFATLGLSVWTELLCYGVFELAVGRPASLACLVMAMLVVRDPLKLALALLTVARRLEERGARIRAIIARRPRRT